MSGGMKAVYGLTASILMAMATQVAAQGLYGPVKPGEGVYAVASQFRDQAGELNLRQWALAIYARNPEAFDGGLGGLKTGAQLRIPSETEVETLWRDGQARLARGATTSVDLVGDRSLVLEPSLPSSWLEDQNQAAIESAPEVAPATQTQPDAKSTPLASPSQQTSQTNAATTFEDEPGDSGAFVEHPLYPAALAAAQARLGQSVVNDLESLEGDFAGDGDFDYLYGVALLDSGRPQEALYALLRASTERPRSLGVRLDLGRAYYEIGENESARSVFEALAQQDPPPRAAQVIDSYLLAINQRAGRYQQRWSAALAAQAGHDSNVNSATDLQNFAGFTLDEASRGQDSPYYGLVLSVDHSLPISPRWFWTSNLYAQNREYSDVDTLNNVQYGLSSGPGYRRGNWSSGLRVNFAEGRIDGDRNSRVAGASLSLAHRDDGFWRYQASTKYAQVRYQDNLEVRDVDQYLLSLGASRRINLAFGSEFGLNLLAGQDEAQEPASPYGRDILGLALVGVSQLAPRWRLDLLAQALVSDYEGEFFGQRREDDQLSLEVALLFKDKRWADWSLRLKTAYVEQSSNVELYDYDRLELGVMLRRQFD